MLRKIIKIDADKCNGCGLCASACHEGAISMIDGKAVLTRDDYCDGLGNCLPVCPTGAISFEEREALPFSEEEVKKNMMKKTQPQTQESKLPCGCPGTHSKSIERKETSQCRDSAPAHTAGMPSQLRQWPVQIKLVPVNAPYFEDANLLIAADCTAFAYGNMHGDFMKNKVTLIGCPKLDDVDYAEKLTAIIANNNIKSVTVIKMEVPCCMGIAVAVKTALQNSGKMIPWRVVTIGIDGTIIED